MAQVDYYRVLQVDPEAEHEIIEAAYRRLAKMYHPDVHKERDATARMQRINEAYEALRDPVRRRSYDLAHPRQGTQPAAPSSGASRRPGPSSSGQPRPRPKADYILRFGIYRGDNLLHVHQVYPGYLQSYLRSQAGDIAERNAIRAYLRIPRASWEVEGAETKPPPPRPKPPSSPPPDPPPPPGPGEYILRYGMNAGWRLADIHRAKPGYLFSYLQVMYGTTDERRAIGQFLGVDPLEVRAEYVRQNITTTPPQRPLVRERRPLNGRVGVLVSLGVAGLFIYSIIAGGGGTATPTPRPANALATPPSLRPSISTPAPGAPVFQGRSPSISTIDPRALTPVVIPTVFIPNSMPPISPYTPIPGSWVATGPAIAIRFYSVPWWEEKPEYSDATRLSLGSVSNVNDFEALDIYRFRGQSGSSTAPAWQVVYAGYTLRSTLYAPILTSEPRPQKAAGFDGIIGQFHYSQTSNDSQVDVTMWVGQVNGDQVVMIFRCDPVRDPFLDQAVAQVLATIDFTAS